MRKEIDVIRKEQKNQNRVNKGYNSEISGFTSKVKEVVEKGKKDKNFSEEQNVKILAMKAKLEFDKNSFEDKIQELQCKLKEPDQFDMEKTQSKTLDAKTGMGGSASQAEFSNPAALLKLRLQRWVHTNKEKKHLMDMYIRNVNIIKDAFE